LFQSTPPRGGRPNWEKPKGGSKACFNPRPRAGGDLNLSQRNILRSWFQSTPPRGGRRTKRPAIAGFFLCFNPRPRAGGDRQYLKRHGSRRCFNPRPRAGGDALILS